METRTVGDVVIIRYNVIASPTMIYSAWVPDRSFGGHSTITTIDDKTYGRIGTEILPPEIEALPSLTVERIRVVEAFTAQQEARAYTLIAAAYPECESGESRRRWGEITTYHDETSPGRCNCGGEVTTTKHNRYWLRHQCGNGGQWQTHRQTAEVYYNWLNLDRHGRLQ